MKKIIYLLTSLLLIGCSTTTKVAQQVKEATRSEDGHLYGEQNRQALETAPFDRWYKANYEEYTPNETALKTIKNNRKNVTVEVYMGTWCSDSRRETPKFFKLMDQAGVKSKNMRLITLDRSKKEPAALVKGKNITNVPTFIFYKKGEEIGRFVEQPVEDLERDIAKILSGADYKHYYEL